MNGEIVKNNSNINHSAQPSDWGRRNKLFERINRSSKKVKKLFIYIIFFFSLFNLKGQQLFYSTILNGGVTADGFTATLSSGTGLMTVSIPSSSSIEKAFLFCGSHGLLNSIDIVFNGVTLRYDSSTIISNSFLSEFYAGVGGKGFVHVKDITQYVSSSQLTYQLTIPPQNSSNIRFTDFYLIVIYKENSMSKTAVSIFINNEDINKFINYHISNINPVDTSFDIGLSVHGGYMCDTIIEPTLVHINSNFIGKIGGNDYNNNFICGGVVGSFFYENNSLYGLGDDIADSLMKGSDGLAIINSYVSPSFSNFNILYEVQSNNSNNWLTNPVWSSTIAYTTPCDTFTTTATTTQDTICLGNSVQLNATGGSTYSWFGAFGGLSDTSSANPMASPPQTTTYIVTIKNDSGCVKTEHIKIWVTQPIDSITTTPTTCGNATGSITAHYNTNANYNFTLFDNNFNPLANNTTGVFNQMPEGTYIVESAIHNCIFYDTVAVGYTNNVQAAFIRNPIQGKAPLTVTLTNISNNANQFIWLLPNDTFYTQHLTYTFTNGGSYPVCLVAYNNQPHCTDTTCFTFIVEGNVGLIIPNVFTPNNDGFNDVFSIQVIDAELISTIEVIIYNRWGEKMYEYINNESTPELLLWDGVTSSGNKASEGTYFYVISYTNKAGETVTEKGTVSLLR